MRDDRCEGGYHYGCSCDGDDPAVQELTADLATLRAQLAEAVAQRDELIDAFDRLLLHGHTSQTFHRTLAAVSDVWGRIRGARQPKPATGDVDARDPVHEVKDEVAPKGAEVLP